MMKSWNRCRSNECGAPCPGRARLGNPTGSSGILSCAILRHAHPAQRAPPARAGARRAPRSARCPAGRARQHRRGWAARALPAQETGPPGRPAGAQARRLAGAVRRVTDRWGLGGPCRPAPSRPVSASTIFHAPRWRTSCVSTSSPPRSERRSSGSCDGVGRPRPDVSGAGRACGLAPSRPHPRRVEGVRRPRLV